MLLPAFTPKPIAAIEPFTRDLCRELLAATEGRPSFDAAVTWSGGQVRGPRTLPVTITRNGR